VAEDLLPAEGVRSAQCPPRGRRAPRGQPPVVLRLALRPQRASADGAVRGEGRVLRRRGRPRQAEEVQFFTNTGNVPIDRSGASAAEGALITAKRILNDGHIFGIYPEGTRSHDGRLYKGKVGVAVIAIETGVPVIPVAVIGTDKLAPQGKKFGRWTRPVITFGEPMSFAQYAGQQGDREVLRKVTDEIMDAIQALSGQEYVRDTYAADAKRAAKEARKADGGSAA
jgi:1-acyl-sn-glycerol-3-phosphate acyltransferase